MTEAERDIVGAFREWQAIEDEKTELSERSKELFAALKAKGYDTKATRAVFRDKRKELLSDPAEVQETEAIYDLYWTALNKGLSEPRARPASARVENIEEFPPAPERKTAGSAPRDEGSKGANPGGEDVDRSASARPSGQDTIGAQSAGVDADIDIERNTSGPDAKRAPHSNPQASSSRQADSPASTSPEPGTHSDDFHPERITFLSKPVVLKPLCLHPGEECSGYGSTTCHACLKAAAESEAA